MTVRQVGSGWRVERHLSCGRHTGSRWREAADGAAAVRAVLRHAARIGMRDAGGMIRCWLCYPVRTPAAV